MYSSTNNHCQRSRDLCTRHCACMMTSNAFPFSHTCGSLSKVLMQQSLCLQWWDNVYNSGSTNSCTVRFVYRIFEYSFVLGIFDSLRFRIFVLALMTTIKWKYNRLGNNNTRTNTLWSNVMLKTENINLQPVQGEVSSIGKWCEGWKRTEKY